jgi:hypothetical protein
VRVFSGGAAIDLFGFDERYYQLFEIDLRFSEGRLLARSFGEELIIEQVTTNAIEERFLAQSAESPLRGLEEPLLHAVNAMARHLSNDNAPAHSGATLRDAAATMRVLWQAAELA